MDDTEREIEKLLAPLRDDLPATPAGVSVERAVEAGRRRQRVRSRLAGAAAALVAVAVCGLLAVMLRVDGGRDSAAGPPGGFDVLTRSFQVGSAGGFTPESYESGRTEQRVRLRLERPAAGQTGQTGQTGQGSVTLLAPGQLPSGWTPTGRRMPDVYGREAVLLDTPMTAAGGVELAWRWSDTGWAFAHLDAAFPDLADRAHRVAQSVLAVPADPLAVPFTVALPPAAVDLQVTGLRVPAGDTGERGSVLLGEGGAAPPIGPGFVVAVSIRSDLAPGPDVPVTGEVGGRPASVRDGRMILFDVAPGLSAVVEAAPGGRSDSVVLEELAASVELAPNPGDPATWPTHPLR
jgi:hypothetical protein